MALLTLSQNFADWFPGASGNREDLSESERAEWTELVFGGAGAAQAGDCARALEAFERALVIDDTHAGLHFRIASCHRALGDAESARLHYHRASDLDRIPHGAPTAFNTLLRELAEERDLIFVDTSAALERAAVEGGLVGDDLFVEFAHPNLRAHQVMAEEVERALRSDGLPRPTTEWPELDWPETPIDTLVAQDPLLRVREHEAIRFVCAVARRQECAAEQKRIIDLLRSQISR